MATIAWRELDWIVANDTVMGGVSTASIAIGDTLVLTGGLSLEGNGGFVSIRARPPAGTFAGARAIRVHLRGDGRTWNVTMRRSDVLLPAGSYRLKVPTSNEGAQVELPLSAFRPMAYGRPATGLPALDAAPERVDTVGFLLADRRSGPFELEVLGLTVVPGAVPRGPDHDAAIRDLHAVVSTGVLAFNSGDQTGCLDLYAEALERVLDHPALTAGERSLVEDALGTVPDLSPADGAWTLRHALESLLSSAPT